ncbi:MAG: ATP-binding protein [Myxococcota bacterium]
MSLYLIVPLLACVVSTILATTILARSQGDRAHRLAALLVSSATVWAFYEVLWNVQTHPAAVLSLVKASAVGWVWIGPLSLQLFLQVTGEPAPRVRRALPLLYAASLTFLLIDWFTPWVHSDAVRTSWGWTYESGPAFPLFYAHTLVCLAIALNIGRRAYRVSLSPGERHQARWLAVGIFSVLIAGSLTDGVLPALGVQLPRLGTAALTAIGGMIAWTFHRYGYSLLAPGTFADEILDTLRDGVALLRPDGRIRSVNGAMVSLLGSSVGRLDGSRLTDRIAGLPSDLSTELTERQCELISDSGGRLPVSVSSTLLRDKRGAAIGLVLVVRDLREIVSLRDRLTLSGRLAAVGQLAAGIAHEINNPLAFVRANLGMLRENWSTLEVMVEKATEPAESAVALAEGEELIDESLEGVDRAVAIVRDVMGLAHAGRGRREAADLNALLDGVLRIAAPQLRQRGRIEKRYGAIPPLLCEPQELQQVFLNLVVNASQAIEPTGTIRITTQSEGDWAVVCVEDDGSGISAELLERIFDPFFTTKPVGEGTGLGLGIAFEIVRWHGGDIAVESQPGRGSRFRVRLPIHADTIEPPA